MLWSTTPFHVFLYWEEQTGNTNWFDAAETYRDLNQSYLPLFLFVAITCLIMLFAAEHMQKKQTNLFSYSAMFTIGSHIFLSRGNYKYYDSFFMPFVVIALVCWGENLDTKLPKFIRSFSEQFAGDTSTKKGQIKLEKIESTLDRKIVQICLRIFAFLIFCGVISWVFILNIWIIFRVKWLHMFYTFLLAITMVLTFDLSSHIALVNPNNYTDLWSYTKKEYTIIETKVQELKTKIKKIRGRKEEDNSNEEKLS